MPVYHMPDGKNWMFENHARARVFHDGFHLFPAVGFIAMNGAVGAGGFVFLVGTFLEALFGVAHQFSAVLT